MKFDNYWICFELYLCNFMKKFEYYEIINVRFILVKCYV